MDPGLTNAGWTAWVRANAGKLLLYARQQTRCEADAEDVLQEALTEAWQRGPHGEPPPLPLVVATIRRRAIDFGRREVRRMHRELTAGAGSAETWFDAGPEQRELGLWVQAALARLPAPQREIIVLKLWGDLTFAEIAEALDIPPNTAASRYRYGLEALKRLGREVLA